jgi:hypothetical protein
MVKVYYSKMNATPNSIILAELLLLKNAFGEKNIQFHNSGKYDETKLTNSDVVIVTGFNGGKVGKGVYSEISKAIENSIPVFQFTDEAASKIFYHVTSIHLYDRSDVYKQYGQCEIEVDEFEDQEVYGTGDVLKFAEKLNLGSKKGPYPSIPDGESSEEKDPDAETNMMY